MVLKAGKVYEASKSRAYLIRPLAGALIVLSILSGCSVQPVTGTRQNGAGSSLYEYLELATSQGRPAATGELLKEGRKAWLLGDTDKSLQKLGRALRISPDDGLIYFYLASVRNKEGESGKAVALARRGLFLAHQPLLQEQLKKLLSSLEP